ncbi:MAG: sodium:proline symporter [Porticoccaceae bacterium]|nr:sodium:proline symporter [Porticoccaceae bacterium]
MITSFVVFLLAFTLIGLSSSWKSRHTKEDYYLASKSISPWLAGLSAVATNNSGYMFIGVIGYTYVTGLASIWLMIGWIAGDLIGSLFVHSRLRTSAGETGEPSFSGAIRAWAGVESRQWQLMAAIASFVLLLAYAGAQLVAGSKALHVLIGWPQWAGAVVGAVMVALYCMAGGIRASIWTDAAQSVVMITSMGLLLVTCVSTLGGMDQVVLEMAAIDGYLDWFPKDLVVPGLAGGVIFALGWMFAGLSVVGQPHVMVRFMTLTDPGHMTRARIWYYLWFTAFYAMATGVGMLSRIFLTDAASFDAELALPTMAMEILPGPLVGLVLAGIFAATMSTADSLLLSCSSALTHDILPRRIEKARLLKIATVLITALALAWALFNRQSVFSLVIMAWSGLAVIFAPVLLVLACGGRLGNGVMVAMSVTGMAVAICWRYLGWHADLYEGMPGILAALLVYGFSRLPLFATASTGQVQATEQNG